MEEYEKDFNENPMEWENETLPLEAITKGQICTLTKVGEGSCDVCYTYFVFEIIFPNFLPMKIIYSSGRFWWSIGC